MDDQFARLSAQFFAGRNMRALPFGSVDDLMESLEDLALNQTRATVSVRLAGGMFTWSRTYNQAFRSRQLGGVMSGRGPRITAITTWLARYSHQGGRNEGRRRDRFRDVIG